MGGKTRPPEAPDPYKVAAATTQSNQQTASFNKALNATNQSNPFGAQSTVQTGTDPKTGAPIYSTSTSANSDVSSIIRSLLGTAGAPNSSLNTALSGLAGLSGQYAGLNSQFSGLGSDLATAHQSAAAAAQKGTDAHYNQAMAYLQPQQEQATAALQSQLANQGLVPGSQAYNNAAANLSRSQTFTNNQALDSAQTQGQQLGLNQLAAAQGLAGTQAGLLQAQAGNLNNQGATFGQLAGASSLPLSQLSALLSLLPQYAGTGSSSASGSNLQNNVYGSYQGQLNAANARTASANSTLDGLFSLGGTLGAAAIMA